MRFSIRIINTFQKSFFLKNDARHLNKLFLFQINFDNVH